MSLKLTKLFEELARATWYRLRDADTYECSQSEETITDLNLLEIVRQEIPGVIVYKVKKEEESLTGLDWEFWIGSDIDGWWQYAIQAKKLYLKSGCYDKLRHKVDGEFQITRLKNYAKDKDAIPLYCFYNHTNKFEPAKWNCCMKYSNPEQLGCSIVPLKIVQEIHDKRMAKTFEAIHHHNLRRAYPWRCLTCYNKFAGSSIKSPNASQFRNPLDIGSNQLSLPGFSNGEPAVQKKRSLPEFLDRRNQATVGGILDFDDQRVSSLLNDYYSQGIYPKRILIMDQSIANRDR